MLTRIDPVTSMSHRNFTTLMGKLEMNRNSYLLLTTAALALCATFAHAQDGGGSTGLDSASKEPTVVLNQRDGSASNAGQLLDFEGGFYTLLTADGDTIRVSTDAVICDGTGCPVDEVAGGIVGTEIQDDEVTIDLPEVDIRLTGSSTIGLKLLPALMEDYAAPLNADIETSALSEKDTYVRYLDIDGAEVSSIHVKSTESGDAFIELAERTVDFGMASRRALSDEIAGVVDTGDIEEAFNETVIAMDSLTVITHPDNPVRVLSLAQIARIYEGEITNWSELGGPDALIVAVSAENGSSTRDIFEDVVFSSAELDLGPNVVFPGGDHQEVAATVRENPSAIGYVSAAFAEGLGQVALASGCGITSTATTFNIKTEQYPLVRRLYLYNRADGLSQDAEQFLNYAQSQAADDAIERSDFVSFAVERATQSLPDVDITFDRLPTSADIILINQLSDDMVLWDRLSTTVRFPSGTFVLGNKELNDLQRLISYLEVLPTGTRVAVVGFTDDVGGFDSNLSLSESRAATVTQQITDLAGSRLQNIAFETRAYGELSPAACNTSANGRDINRRVEVWVRK